MANENTDQNTGKTVGEAPAPAKKSSKKKGKAPATVEEPSSASSASSALPQSPEEQREMQEQIEAILKLTQGAKGTNKKDAATHKKEMGDHKFWSTQPVPQHGEKIVEDGPIEPDIPHDEIRKEAYPLPKEFEWCEVDITKDAEIKELYELLTNNYVEDDDAMFRFDYSAPFLKWALQPPGWNRSWHIGVRVVSNKKLVAFISGIPADIKTYDKQHHLVEINYLCVHKRLRSKRLAPVLIKEVTRRIHLVGIFQAVYTAGVVLPKPVSTCRYYHRSLNPKKLVETEFSRFPRKMTMARMIKMYKVPNNTSTPGLRPMTVADAPHVRVLLNEFLAKFDIAPIFTSDEEVTHWLVPVEGVVWSYVVEDPNTHLITDFASFYALPSSVIGHQEHKVLNAAYVFYYAISIPESAKGDKIDERRFYKTRLTDLMRDLLTLAYSFQFDVFNCLDLMDNSLFIEDLKFGAGDGYLNYYLYNWKCRDVRKEKVGLVML